jgi:type I restriction enzyme, R subunit
MISEAQARVIIDEQLKDSGWDLTNPNNVSLETTVDEYRLDYLLKDKNGHPLAVLEAKKPGDDLRKHDAKTKKYAEKIKVDLIFLANSEKIYFWDLKQSSYPYEIKSFYSQIDLERKTSLRKNSKEIKSIQIDKKITDRKYQIDCIEKISDKIENGEKSFLVEMATGTGKTRLAISLINRLFKANRINKVLYVCDRFNLVDQTDKNFQKFITDQSSYILNSKGLKDEKSIIISTIQTFIRQYDSISSGYFDLIIIDECHRSIYGKYRKSLDRFDSIKIGLTATPCKYDNDNENSEDVKSIKDTLKFFELDEPTFTYDLKQGIKEKFLVPYLIYKAKTIKTSDDEGISINKDEIDWNKINEKDKKNIENLFDKKDKAIIPHTWLERKITIPKRNYSIVNEFLDVMENGYSDNGTIKRPIFGKTIVFAVTQSHAITLAKLMDKNIKSRINNENTSERIADFVVSDQNNEYSSDAKTKIDNFIKKKNPKVLVSVGMLDTGFDCPEVTNILFARFTKSNILYRQMRGRGCRPSEVFDKKNFWIFDFVGNTTFHGDKEEGDGGVVVVKEPKEKKYNKKGLIEIDVEDWIDPSSREIIDIDDDGTVIRPKEDKILGDKIYFKCEEWLNKQKNMNLEKEKFCKIVGEYVRSNINDIKQIEISDFTYPPFTNLRRSPEEVFGGEKNLSVFLENFNKEIISGIR